MSETVLSVAHRRPYLSSEKVLSYRGQNHNAKLLVHPQATISRFGLPRPFSIDQDNTLPSTAFSSKTKIEHRIEPGSFNAQVNMAWYKIDVTVSNNATYLQPSFLWIDPDKGIEIRPNSGSSEPIDTIYPENIVLWLLSLPPYERDLACKRMNCEITKLKSGKSVVVSYKQWQTSDNNFVYIPIPTALFRDGFWNPQQLSKPLLLRLYTIDDVTTKSGTSTDVTVSNCTVEFECDEPTIVDFRKINAENVSKVKQTRFLKCFRREFTDKTLNASTKVKFKLDFVENERAPFLTFHIRQAAAPSDDNKYMYYELGNNGKVDLLHNNNSILQDGNSFIVEQLDEVVNNKIACPLRNFYFVPFCHDIVGAWRFGKHDMSFYFDKEYDLELETDSAHTAEVHTINVGSAPDAGKYSISYRELSRHMDYNETAANIKTNLEAMRCFRERGYTCTIDDPLSTGTDTSITFHSRDGDVLNEIDVPRLVPNNLTASATDITISAPSVTYYNSGFDATTLSSANNVTVCVWAYRMLNCWPNGDITISQELS